jgi:hypothetical protein
LLQALANTTSTHAAAIAATTIAARGLRIALESHLVKTFLMLCGRGARGASSIRFPDVSRPHPRASETRRPDGNHATRATPQVLPHGPNPADGPCPAGENFEGPERFDGPER